MAHALQCNCLKMQQSESCKKPCTFIVHHWNSKYFQKYKKNIDSRIDVLVSKCSECSYKTLIYNADFSVLLKCYEWSSPATFSIKKTSFISQCTRSEKGWRVFPYMSKIKQRERPFHDAKIPALFLMAKYPAPGRRVARKDSYPEISRIPGTAALHFTFRRVSRCWFFSM